MIGDIYLQKLKNYFSDIYKIFGNFIIFNILELIKNYFYWKKEKNRLLRIF